MVVKVISEGPVVTRKVVCGKCAYQLEYTLEDVENFTKHDYDGGSDTYYFIVCPRCKHHTNVRGY